MITMTFLLVLQSAKSRSASNLTNESATGTDIVGSTLNYPTTSSINNSTSNASDNPGVTLSTTTLSYTAFWQYAESIKWFKYCSPILITLATVGNALSVVTLQNPLFRSSSTSFILSALAVVDVGIVNTGLVSP
jgi:hypothetical protein